jgi:hypothetical protein
MATVTNGGAMSGNSSVCSLPNAIRPKTTSASIDTTVTMGRLIAKSEMNMLEFSLALSMARRIRRRADRGPACPARSRVAAPTSSVSPGVSPDFTSTRSDSSSRRPSSTFDALDLAILEPDDERLDAGDVDRRGRYHKHIPALARDAPLGEQAADEVVARVRHRDDDAHLTGRRVGIGLMRVILPVNARSG